MKKYWPPPTSVRLLRSRQLRGEGTEGSHAKLLGERGQLGKAQVPLVWHKRDQQASRLANATGKWQLPIKREEVTPPSQAWPSAPWPKLAIKGFVPSSSRLGIAAPTPRRTGQAHVTWQLSCVPVTPFCHRDASAANGGANYLLATAPWRVHHAIHDGEETSPYSYLIMKQIAHVSTFRPCKALVSGSSFTCIAELQFHHTPLTAPQFPEKKGKKRVFFPLLMIFGITYFIIWWRSCFVLVKEQWWLAFKHGQRQKEIPNPMVLKRGEKGKERLSESYCQLGFGDSPVSLAGITHIHSWLRAKTGKDRNPYHGKRVWKPESLTKNVLRNLFGRLKDKNMF